MTKFITYASFLFILFSMFILYGCSKSYEDIPKETDIFSEKTKLSECKVVITFAEAPGDVSIKIPALKYNKDFCLGFHLDDGAQDLFSHAFQLLNGGTIDDTNYSGLAYTDGCGNDLKFKMGTSIYSMTNDQLTDLHDPIVGNSYYLNWAEIIELYKNGWGVHNHGYTAEPDIDPMFSIVKNHAFVKLKTMDEIEGGINMRIFVNPNGIETFTAPAFQQNYKIAFTESYLFANPYFNIAGTWPKSNITMGRSLLENINLPEMVDQMAEESKDGVHNWGCVFTHSLTNADHGYGFDRFKDQMIYIANKYGKNGLDNIWMTTEEETLDYSILREKMVLTKVLTGNKLEITISGEFPIDLRFVSTSLVVSSNADISNIVISGVDQSSFNGIGTKTALINLCSDKI